MDHVSHIKTCVYCRRQPVHILWHPFCSERCKMLDLQRWLDGGYRIAAEPTPLPEPEPDDGASGPASGNQA